MKDRPLLWRRLGAPIALICSVVCFVAWREQTAPLLTRTAMSASAANTLEFDAYLPLTVVRRNEQSSTTPPPTRGTPSATKTAKPTADPSESPYSGCLVVEAFDDYSDGSVDRLKHFAYDDLGQLRTELLDRDANGTIESTQRRTYAENGVLLTRQWFAGESTTLTKAYTYTYDEQRRLTWWRLDLDGDGSVDRTYEYTHDDHRGLVSIEQDRDADGSIDHVCRYNIPVGANTSRTECDSNNDGVVDSSELVVKSNDRIVEIRHDDDNDGVADWATLYEYDDAGRVILQGTDGDLDGAVDDWEEFDYSDGLLAQTRGFLDRVLEYTVYDEYDERGRRTRRHFDNVYSNDATLTYEIECN